MSVTAGDLITEASAHLHGWGGTADRVTPLTANITAGATSFTVDFAFGQAVGITPGVVEIDSELLYVTAVDSSTGICSLANGFGRGYRGTTATSHTAGTPVISRPRFPRSDLLKQLNNVLGGIFPDLFKVLTTTTTVTFPSDTYVLPGAPTSGGPVMALDAQWQDPIGNWHKCYSFSIDQFDNSFRLGDGPMIGRPLRIVYGIQPGTFSAETDDFAAITGLPPTSADVLTLGVVARVIPALDISRAQLTSVEQSDRSRVVPPFQGLNTGKFYQNEYAMRLANESVALRSQYTPRITRTF